MPTPETVAELTMFWSNRVDRLEATIVSLRNDLRTYNDVIAGLKDGELTWDNVQILETGQLRVIPPAPPVPVPEICVEEVSKDFGKKNRKKADTFDSSAELVEVGSDGN